MGLGYIPYNHGARLITEPIEKVPIEKPKAKAGDNSASIGLEYKATADVNLDHISGMVKVEIYPSSMLLTWHIIYVGPNTGFILVGSSRHDPWRDGCHS